MKLFAAVLILLPFLISRLYSSPSAVMNFLFGRKRKAPREEDLGPDTHRKMAEQDSPLLDLPDEVLLNIVDQLEYEDLLAVRAASRHLQALAEPRLYREYDVETGVDGERLATLIKTNPKRATWLRSVLVSTRFNQDGQLVALPAQIRQMRNLRHLVLETPDCNAKTPQERWGWVDRQQDYEEILSKSTLATPLEDRLLGKLETMTLHLVDERNSLYRLPKYSSIFVHPTLKSLTLSCACTDHHEALLPRHRRFKKSTALEHLHLEECDVDPETLALLLKFPRALKSFKLSEGTRYDTGYGAGQARMHGDLRPDLLSGALARSVGDTLETLSLSMGAKNVSAFAINLPGRALDLKSMTKLKELALSWDSLTLICPRPNCDHEFYRRLPDTIETLRIFSIPVVNLRGGALVPFRSCVFKSKSEHGLPKLKTLVYRYEYQSTLGRGGVERRGVDTVGQIIKAYIESMRRAHDRRLRLYKRSGTRVLVEIEVTPSGYIPPYLNNEEHPVIQQFWDSGAVDLDDKQGKERPTSSSQPVPVDEGDETGDEDEELNLGGRQLTQFLPHMESLLNFMVLQPGHGMPT